MSSLASYLSQVEARKLGSIRGNVPGYPIPANVGTHTHKCVFVSMCPRARVTFTTHSRSVPAAQFRRKLRTYVESGRLESGQQVECLQA